MLRNALRPPSVVWQCADPVLNTVYCAKARTHVYNAVLSPSYTKEGAYSIARREPTQSKVDAMRVSNHAVPVHLPMFALPVCPATLS